MERSVLTATLAPCFIFGLHKTHVCPFKRRGRQATQRKHGDSAARGTQRKTPAAQWFFPAQVLFSMNSRADTSTLIFSFLYSGLVEHKVNEMTLRGWLSCHRQGCLSPLLPVTVVVEDGTAAPLVKSRCRVTNPRLHDHQ